MAEKIDAYFPLRTVNDIAHDVRTSSNTDPSTFEIFEPMSAPLSGHWIC